jgi:protease-4
VAFGKRVAEIVGSDKSGGTVAYKATRYGTYLARLPALDQGKAIAVVTVAGEIVDGEAGPGTAGGDRIAALIDKATTSGDYSGMVVRVDSPGGSVMASERIRSAIARFKAKGAPVAVSMGGLAASGGYWVSTPADRIFAEPNTITGSIGIFAVIPTFEDTLRKFGIGTDGVRTTALSGQPDVLGGLSPAMEGVLQAEIDVGYHRFVGLVAASRHKTPEAVDAIAQGRIWDGGTARQIGLVDEFGDLDQAVAWVAHRVGTARYHPVYLGDVSDGFAAVLQQILDDDGQGDASDDSTHAAGHDLVGRVAAAQVATAGHMAGDLERLLGGHGAQAYCLECAGLTPPAGDALSDTLAATLSDTGERSRWLSLLFSAHR